VRLLKVALPQACSRTECGLEPGSGPPSADYPTEAGGAGLAWRSVACSQVAVPGFPTNPPRLSKARCIGLQNCLCTSSSVTFLFARTGRFFTHRSD
jgi:hypothetical protein